MINRTLKDNWKKILDFNANRKILQEPEKVKEYVRIPLTPISINANLLYQFFEILYPNFINDQQNILDIIIIEEDKKNKLQALYLYKTSKAGIHETVESLPIDKFRIKKIEIEAFDELFDKIQKMILKEKNVRISSIRLFREKAVDLINNYCEGLVDLSVYEFLERAMDLVQTLISQDLFLIYPEPIIIEFLRTSFKLLDRIKLQDVFKFIENHFPEFNIAILIEGRSINLIIQAQKQVSKFGKSALTLKFLTPEELNFKLSKSDIPYNLNLIQQQLKTENTYFIKQNDIISFLSDFFELSVPLKKDKVSFLLQKVLFWFRSFENHWQMVPRPKVYNTLMRFLIRLFGFNLNLRKLSHWAIPDLIFNYIDTNLGLNSKILCIITDQEKNKNTQKNQKYLSKRLINHIVLLSFEESTLTNVQNIDKENLLSENRNLLSSIHEKSSKEFGFITSVFVLDKFLLTNIIKYFLVNHSNVSVLPKFKMIKILKNEKFFNVFPEFPLYLLLKKKSPMALARLFLPILIDKHEF
ncbi:MAG: hypothetical protein ACFE9S_17205 [Candidatus Hermodarchaeota archaeon]